MDEIVTVTIFAIVILLITLLAGRLPFYIKKSPSNLHLLITFSTGVMIGVLFIMLLPEALERTSDSGHSFELASYMILIGFVLLLIIDFFVKRYLQVEENCAEEKAHTVTSLSAFAGLAIHSFFDGLALAAAFIAGEEVGIMVLIALCLHKAVVVFSLASTLLMSENKTSAWKFILAFSVISPIAAVVSYVCMNSGSMDFAGPALCFSVGIFMFVTLCDMVPEAFHHKDKGFGQISVLILGLILVALVATISGMLMGELDI